MEQQKSTNATHEYGVKLYTRWCAENNLPLIAESLEQPKNFIVAHKKGWPTGKPKTLATLKLRLQSIKRLYKDNESQVDFKPLTSKLNSLQ